MPRSAVVHRLGQISRQLIKIVCSHPRVVRITDQGSWPAPRRPACILLDARCGAGPLQRLALPRSAGTRFPALHDPIARGRLAKPSGAELRRAPLRLEVHVGQAETVAVAIDPFEVVLCAPEE